MQIRIRIRKFKIPVLGIQPLDYHNIRVKSEPNHWKGLYKSLTKNQNIS